MKQNLLTDTKVLEQTQQAVKEIVTKDKHLELEENRSIKEALFLKYGEQLRNIVG